VTTHHEDYATGARSLFGFEVLDRLEAQTMRRLGNRLALLGAISVLAAGCGDPQPAVSRVGTNVVEKSAFTGSWYMYRTVIEMEYEGAPLDFVGDNAGDGTGGFLGFSIPRIRWVIDENFLYAYRDYEIVGDPEDPFAVEGDNDPDFLGQPVAAFRIESHFDIRREYNTVTGEELNLVVEDTVDRHWYERQFMRVDWSQNLLTSYFGNGHNLSELFGFVSRESTPMFVQDESTFPAEWRPRFHFMSCNGLDDTECDADDQDWAGDYGRGTMYSMSFVTQEVLAPGAGAFGFPLCRYNADFAGFPECASVAIWIRTSFLRVSDTREYYPVGWDNDRFDRAGYFALDRPTYDRTHEAGDPSFGFTDFTNQSANRHNIWRNWFQRDGSGEIVRHENGEPVLLDPRDREVRPIVWYNTRELPAHLLRPAFEVTGEWNNVFMSTVRQVRGQDVPVYPPRECQSEDPGGACYCQRDPDTDEILNPTCAGQYDPFVRPEDSGATNPFDCYAVLVDPETGAESNALNAEPDYEGDLGVSDSDFNGWFNVEMRGTECVNILRNNTCNASNQAQWGELECQQRGDVRYKFLSFVDQPGTPFLGVATMRGDPLTGEIISGDANIGGPAMNFQRSRALEAYDLINGNITVGEYYTGEDLRAYITALEHVELPAPPRIDFNAAMNLGVALDPSFQAGIDAQMARAMERAEQLRGPEGRAAVYSDRLQRLAGTDVERRLVSGVEAYPMAGMDWVPQHASPETPSDDILAAASPFRNGLEDRLAAMADFNTRLGLSNMMLPNEYTDDSVLSFVNQHRTWSRVRVEFELQRRLYRDTQVHEMGHCLGLRHHFGGTSDPHNYFDGYYTINEEFPLPDPNTFNTDGTPGLSPDEQILFEDAFSEARRRRELAGIDQWMNSSVMDYTPNFYQRINGAGRHDYMAISFGYGDIVDIYNNGASEMPNGDPRSPTQIDRITPVNTPRVGIKYYHGGETCSTDADCPYSAGGSRASELLDSNTASGLVQGCVTSGREGEARTCSNFDDDANAMLDGATGAPDWVPVRYFYCEDIAANTRSVPGCSTFDAGDSFRDIVENQIESYERDYIFAAFRRYRADFSIGSYFGRLTRFLLPLLGIYTNLIYRYASDPEFRNQEGSFGFYDQFLATADIMNFFARMLAQPSIGSYEYNDGWDRYELSSLDIVPDAQVSVPLGQGRYLNSIYQSGLTGIYRVERVGSIYDSIFAMQLLTLRGLGPFFGSDVYFQTNFYDLFPTEMQQVFTGMIASRPEDYMPRVDCADGSVLPRCNDPRIVYMDFYRGDCSVDPVTGMPSDERCRPHPTQVTYRDLAVLNGGTRYFLQSYAAIYALANFPIYYDTTFQNQMFICIEGQGDCHQPDDPSSTTDYVRYTSRRFGKSFLAWRVDANQGAGAGANQTSIAYSMVQEASNLDFIIRILRQFRGDFLPGDPPPHVDNIDDDGDGNNTNELARLGAIGYTLPDASQIQFEIDRLNDRLIGLESFFNYLIQLERVFGIEFPFLGNRPSF
jgi:hypothetical protein